MKSLHISVILIFSAVLLVGCVGRRTPLGLAVNRDDVQAVEDLLSSGADPCEKMGDSSALDLAGGDVRGLLPSDEIKTGIYRMLLDKAYQRFVEGKKCEDILFSAARTGDADMIKKLIEKGEDPNEGKEYWEASPLGIAAYYGHEDAVRALVEGGANVDVQIDNLDKTRTWARTIGRKSSFAKTDNAIKMLSKYKENKNRHLRVEN